jgi:hypothetical protein
MLAWTPARVAPERAASSLSWTASKWHGAAHAARSRFVSYEMSIEPRPGYLHITVRGSNTRDNVTRYMEEVVRECAVRQCPRVLIEERLEGPRLGTLDVFEIVSRGSTQFLGSIKAMAYVDVNAPSREMMQFAENVAVNRAFPVRVFPTVTAAERWLQGAQQQSMSAAAAAASTPASASPAPKPRPGSR